MVDIAGLKLSGEDALDGVSILPLLKGINKLERRAIFWHYPHYGNQGGTPGSSVRAGKYKLIEFFEDNHVELYDLEQDISEEHDISDQMPEKVVELRRLLKEWREKVNAKIPKLNPEYKEDP